MKKFLAVFLMLASTVQAGIFGSEPVKIFKDYPYDTHKTDFLKQFPRFGACEVSSNVICAPSGIEKLYGIYFDINVMLNSNKTESVRLLSNVDKNGIINKESYFSD